MRRDKAESAVSSMNSSESCRSRSNLAPTEEVLQIGTIDYAAGAILVDEAKQSGDERSWIYAIERALQEGEYVAALSMLEQSAERSLELGDVYLLDDWFSALHQHMPYAKPRLQIVAAWVTCFARGPQVMMQRFDIGDWKDIVDPAIRGHLTAIRQLMLAVRDRNDEAYAVGLGGVADVPTMNPFADGMLLSMTIRMATALGEYERARTLLRAIECLPHGTSLHRMYAESVDGIAAFRQGCLRRASSCFRTALSAGPIGGLRSYTGDRAWCATLYATVLYEENDLDAVEHLLNVYPVMVREGCGIGSILSGYRMRIRLAFLSGGAEHAFQLLSELEYYGERCQIQCAIVLAKMERTRIWLQQGKVEEAGEELASIDAEGIWKSAWKYHFPAQEVDDLSLMQLRYQVYTNTSVTACEHVSRALDSAVLAGFRNRALKLRVLLALAHERSGVSERALEILAHAVLDASKEGFVRSILDEGPRVGALIEGLHVAVQQEKISGDSAFVEHLRRLRHPSWARGRVDKLDESIFNAISAQFTRREIRVLQLLALGYSNSAMASSLFLSESTVRTHLRSINTKLGARSRTHAVALARGLGIIE